MGKDLSGLETNCPAIFLSYQTQRNTTQVTQEQGQDLEDDILIESLDDEEHKSH